MASLGLCALMSLSACVQELPVGAVNPKSEGEGSTGAQEEPNEEEDPSSDPSQGPSPDDSNTAEDGKGNPKSNKGTSSGAPKPEKVDCELPEPSSCDDQVCNCLSHALGIGCPGNVSDISNPEIATYTNYPQSKLSPLASELPSAFAPTEGRRAVLLGTGPMEHFMQRPYQLQQAGQCNASRPVSSEFQGNLTCPSGDIPEKTPNHKAPGSIELTAVDPSGKKDCSDNPSLVGKGDCSNSLQKLVKNRSCWDSANTSCDPTEIHDASAFSIQLTVPAGVTTLSFDSAFLTAEYPFNYKHPNRPATDAFVVWLSSKQWTGNVLMDPKGHPMTVDNDWLTLKDAQNLAKDCKAPCNEHKLHLYSMEGHGATPWLTTEFPVHPGERILMTFAVMEFGTPWLDSYALIDNLRWGCSEGLSAPVTRRAK